MSASLIMFTNIWPDEQFVLGAQKPPQSGGSTE